MSYYDEEETTEDEALEKLSSKFRKMAGLDKIENKLGITRDSGMMSKLYSEIDLEKADELRGDEKIVGFFKALVQNDRVALKALSEGVAADGGYLFPDEFKAELIRDLAEPNRMRSLVRVVPMTRDIMKIPKLVSGVKVRWTSENAAKSTTTAEFTEKTLTAYKVAAIMYASEELVEDSTSIDVVKLIISLFAEEIAEEEDKVITAGTGVGQPLGLTNCSITSVSCSGNLTFDDIINLIYSLPAKYRANAKFLVNNTNIRELRKIKDGNSRYIWLDSPVPNQPSTIHGYPVIENNHVPESEIYFGDFKRGYWLGDRRSFVAKVSDVAGQSWEKDEIGIRVTERIAGTCVLENALRKLVSIP